MASYIYYDKNKIINKNNSTNPLAKLSYRSLQKVAVSLNLPAKLKHKVLLGLVIAHKQGRQDIVELILSNKIVEKSKGAPKSSMREKTVSAKTVTQKCTNSSSVPAVDTTIDAFPSYYGPSSSSEGYASAFNSSASILSPTSFDAFYEDMCETSSSFEENGILNISTSSISKISVASNDDEAESAPKRAKLNIEEDNNKIIDNNLESLDTPSPRILGKIADAFRFGI